MVSTEAPQIAAKSTPLVTVERLLGFQPQQPHVREVMTVTAVITELYQFQVRDKDFEIAHAILELAMA